MLYTQLELFLKSGDDDDDTTIPTSNSPYGNYFQNVISSTVQYIHDAIEDNKLDGIYLADVEDVVNTQGSHRVAHVVEGLVDIIGSTHGDKVHT